MTRQDLSRRLAAGLDAALGDAAEALAAEVRHGLESHGIAPDAVTVDRDRAGQATVQVTAPDLVAREYGSWRSPARPLVRPALADATAAARRMMMHSLHRLLSQESPR